MSGSGPFQPEEGTEARFPLRTDWTNLIHPAADPASPEAWEALNRLCRTYWFPLYAYLRGERIESERAKDVIQNFFVHLLEANMLKQADRGRGRFRTFLLACLRNFMRDQWRRENAAKRGGGVPKVSIDAEEAEHRYQKLPRVEPVPERVFDRTWAATVIEEATLRLGRIYARGGKARVFEAVKGCLSGELPPSAYPELAAQLGMTKEALEVKLSRFRKAFGGMVRSVISETVEPSEIDEEIQYLFAAWSEYLNQKP